MPDSLLKHADSHLRPRKPLDWTYILVGSRIEQFLGNIGINIMARVMALIVVAINMTDVRSEIPGLASR